MKISFYTQQALACILDGAEVPIHIDDISGATIQDTHGNILARIPIDSWIVVATKDREKKEEIEK